MGTAFFILLLVSVPCLASAECILVDKGDSVEVVCGEPKVETANQDLSEIIERFKNGISKETFDRCKASMPGDYTADEYAHMTQSQRMDAMNQHRLALMEYVATGCTMPGGSTAIPQQQKYILCKSVGSVTTCSDKTSFTATGDTVTDNKGTTCHIVDSSLYCNN